MLCHTINRLLCAAALSTAQTLTGTNTITYEDVAFLSSNLTAIAGRNPPFQIYHPNFTQILGHNASLSLIYEASFPAFHEAGVVTSLNPLTLYSSSNQFNTTSASPSTNNKTIVVSRTTQNTTSGSWSSEVVQNNTSPLFLANGGFQYKSGILFVAQGTITKPAGLIYLPTTPAPSNTTTATNLLDSYLGLPLNSPNDIYVARNKVAYFTDPQIGYLQHIRSTPQLPNQVYGFVPGTPQIKVVTDDIGSPNGLTFSPDEKTAYLTEVGSLFLPANSLPTSRAIYAYDITYTSGPNGEDGEIAKFSNKRMFAAPAIGIADGIKCDDKGNVWVGCGDGLNVFAPNGLLLGKVVYEGGISNFGFASDGRLFFMAEKKLWLLQVNTTVQPAVPVGETRG